MRLKLTKKQLKLIAKGLNITTKGQKKQLQRHSRGLELTTT